MMALELSAMHSPDHGVKGSVMRERMIKGDRYTVSVDEADGEPVIVVAVERGAIGAQFQGEDLRHAQIRLSSAISRLDGLRVQHDQARRGQVDRDRLEQLETELSAAGEARERCELEAREARAKIGETVHETYFVPIDRISGTVRL